MPPPLIWEFIYTLLAIHLFIIDPDPVRERKEKKKREKRTTMAKLIYLLALLLLLLQGADANQSAFWEMIAKARFWTMGNGFQPQASVEGPMLQTLVYTEFDRHAPGCPGHFLMRSLLSTADTRPAPRGERFQLTSGCMDATHRPTSYFPVQSHRTESVRNLGLPMDGLFGKPTPGWVPLDHHDIQCPDKAGLVRFRLETEWDASTNKRDQTFYTYDCRDLGLSTCTDHFSAASNTFDPNKPYTFYASLRPVISCPAFSVLGGLRMKRNDEHVWGIQYRCCR